MFMPMTTAFRHRRTGLYGLYMVMRDWGRVGPALPWILNFAVLVPGTKWVLWGIVTADRSPLSVYAALKQMAK